jgi:hypothetical protein
MGVNSGKRIRVTLRWIQIKDKLEPFFKEHGEFFFRTKVTTGDVVVEHRLPEKGHWEISDRPRFNRVDKIDKVMFEGEPGDHMVIELFGEEIDQLTENDHLETYRREFSGDCAGWAGRSAPGDEGSADPENMSNWRIGFDVEMA